MFVKESSMSDASKLAEVAHPNLLYAAVLIVIVVRDIWIDVVAVSVFLIVDVQRHPKQTTSRCQE